MSNKENDKSNVFLNIANGYFNDFWETGDLGYKDKCELTCLLSISSVLVEIRDELRIMNERSEKDG